MKALQDILNLEENFFSIMTMDDAINLLLDLNYTKEQAIENYKKELKFII